MYSQANPSRILTGMPAFYIPYKNKFTSDFFKDRIPFELLSKNSTPNFSQYQCMICQNIINTNTSTTCLICSKPVCDECYRNKFQKHDDSEQYEMPCLCISNKQKATIKTVNAKQEYLKEANNLKFRCYFSEECPCQLPY